MTVFILGLVALVTTEARFIARRSFSASDEFNRIPQTLATDFDLRQQTLLLWKTVIHDKFLGGRKVGASTLVGYQA